MKQAEKNRQSRAFILTHAFAEFSAYGYSGSTLNQICEKGNISKGMLYHYYKNKDMLYLACVELLFKDMTAFLKEHILLDSVTVSQYFSIRMHFFQQHPAHRQLFYDVLLYPQSHLAGEVKACRLEFDAFNNQVLRQVLEKEKLCNCLPVNIVLQQFRAFVDFLGVYIQEETTVDAEQKANELLHTMLYGLIAR